MSPATLTTFAWRFGGPLADLPPAVAWTLLAVLGLLGAAWIVFTYRRTLVALAPARRNTLTALRLALWTILLVALAGPTRVERTYAEKPTRPLAVVLDRSDSMTAADNRGARRADDALRRWRALAPAARDTFGEPRAFAFADDFTALSSPAARSSLSTSRTRVFHSLQQTLAAAPAGGWGAVVMLTDGLDTSGTDPKPALDDTVRAALAAGTPLFPIAGRNRFSGSDFITLRDLTVPSQVPPRSTFTLELSVESYQSAPRNIPVRLRVGGTWRAPESLALANGRRALTWSAEIAAAGPGTLPLELVVGEGDSAVTARADVRIAAPDTTRVLYYQGSLDWGFRFLADILRRDPAFALTPIFNLTPADRPQASGLRSQPSSLKSLPDLPNTPAGFDAYDVVVIANTAAGQLDLAQQSALASWVREGGVLLFLAPDDAAMHDYAGTEIERLLPVVFSGARRQNEADAATTAFRRQIQQLGGSHGGAEAAFARDANSRRSTVALSAFAWEPVAGGILGTDTVAAAPRFAHFARVERAKPGATVLARHPSAKSPDGDGAILLALQRYGRGQTAIITSDALWRWKLNQPSSERGAELFWQNLLAWLARERPRGPVFERTPLTAETGRDLDVLVRGTAGTRVIATRDGATPVVLISDGEQGRARRYRWTPPASGMWQLTATDAEQRTARHWFVVTDSLPAGELSGLPPDETLLHELARRTGGAVLENTPPSAWLAAARDTTAPLLRETRTPLWHGALLLATLLALYATELLLRRRWQLL